MGGEDARAWQLSTDRELVYLNGNDCTVLQTPGW